MKRRDALRGASVLCASALLSRAGIASAEPAGLVVDGEMIADAALYAAAKAEGSLLLYATYQPRGMAQILAKFQADTGIVANAIRLPSAEMFDRATVEFSSHHLAADYVDTTDVTLTQQLADRGILISYKPPGFRSFEHVLRDGDGTWYTILRSVISIGVNTALVKPGDIPSNWSDILDPKWKDKSGFANIDAGGSAFSFWFFLRQRYGIDAWRKVAALNPHIGYAAEPVATALARGETAIAVLGIESIVAAVATGSPVKVVLPAGGPAFGIFGGITSVAPHPHAAQLWMNWMTSKRGGSVVSSIGAYAIRRDVVSPTVPGVAMPPSDSLYNIRASDYERSYVPFVKEWHRILAR
jgi:iron(III) transport system substrate-binding protein